MTGAAADQDRPELTIVIPVYNELATIETVLDRVRALEVRKQIVVVDNCSTDGTRELLESLDLGPGVDLVLQPRNFGKGTSVRRGISRARGDYVVCQDADLEYDPADILRLLAAAREGGHDAVFGTRLADPRFREGGHAAFSFGRRFVTTCFNLLFGTRVTDVSTCYKLMRTDVISSVPLVSEGFDLDFEIPARLARRGIAIAEVPVSYRPRSFAEGKKIGWRDGLRSLWAIAKFRFRG
jgi:glycosyltransferase involved in cell wall biosynthesis